MTTKARARKRERTDYIVIHCSATRPSQNIRARDIDRWHRERGWLRIGYHYVIPRNGEIEHGRAMDEIGAHVAGYNWNSVSVCLAGGIDESGKPANNYTTAQMTTLAGIVRMLKREYPDAQVVGHRDLSPDKDGDGNIEPNEWIKACPSFNVKEWAQGIT
jgi:N-acetylmuramoyl-L-alanine amidase